CDHPVCRFGSATGTGDPPSDECNWLKTCEPKNPSRNGSREYLPFGQTALSPSQGLKKYKSSEHLAITETSRFLCNMAAHSDAVFRIPNTPVYWPWPRVINPHYEEVKAASEAWFRSFKAFGPESQCAFDRCNFSMARTLLSGHH
ncbi:hypothetical protein IW261DRAFT_1642056, partial [Armillaria novae-zelandiae]